MFKRHSIAFWATVFVTAVCLSLVAIDAWRSWNARVERLLDMERSTSNLARAMAQQADDTIKAADTSLTDIVERIETDGLGAPALARLHLRLRAQVANLPQLAGLFVYDESGKWLVNSRPTLDLAFNNADREYFNYHRTHPGRGPHVGLPVRSRSSGVLVIPVSRRLNHRDGSFAGVALATIDIDYFRRFYQSFEIGERGAVGLISNAGVLLLRRPYEEAAVGRSVVNSPIFRAYAAGATSGTALFRSGQDGELRLNSFRPLEHYPLFVTAALSKEEMLAPWRRNALLHTLGVLLLAALLGLFGRRLIGQIELRQQAEEALLKTRDALEAANRTLERQAMQDGLTGLANRRQFDLTLEVEFGRAMRHHDTLAFVMLDVDYFKQFNDLYGHSAGDDCLRAVSALIRELTPKRPGDLTARYGGEELGVLLPNTDGAGAHAVADRIRCAIAALRVPHSASPYGVVTVSAGVATIAPLRGVHGAGMLVEAADKALYAAKSAGRNRVCDAPVDEPD